MTTYDILRSFRMRKRVNKKPYTFHIGKKDLEKLEDLAQKTDRSVSSFIREAVRYFLKNKGMANNEE